DDETRTEKQLSTTVVTVTSCDETRCTESAKTITKGKDDGTTKKSTVTTVVTVTSCSDDICVEVPVSTTVVKSKTVTPTPQTPTETVGAPDITQGGVSPEHDTDQKEVTSKTSVVEADSTHTSPTVETFEGSAVKLATSFFAVVILGLITF
ncbi:uncharacterized protein CYBJADRAFT_165112, partial [Cyberlindnera jadinii NRRL Y-1542]